MTSSDAPRVLSLIAAAETLASVRGEQVTVDDLEAAASLVAGGEPWGMRDLLAAAGLAALLVELLAEMRGCDVATALRELAEVTA